MWYGLVHIDCKYYLLLSGPVMLTVKYRSIRVWMAAWQSIMRENVLPIREAPLEPAKLRETVATVSLSGRVYAKPAPRPSLAR